MTEYHVNASRVAEAAGRAHASGEAIRAEVASLVAHLTELEGSWRGGASTAFASLLTEWRTAQAQLESALQRMGTALGQAAGHYEQAEATAARMFGR